MVIWTALNSCENSKVPVLEAKKCFRDTASVDKFVYLINSLLILILKNLKIFFFYSLTQNMHSYFHFIVRKIEFFCLNFFQFIFLLI